MYKVVIADDEPRIRRGLRNVVKWQDYGMEVVDEASDGEMALEKVKEHQPDLLLLDICMPFLNGLELIERLRGEIETDCIIIIITGYDDFEYARKALRLKVFDFLLKPVTRDKFKQTIESAKIEIERRHKEHQLHVLTKKVVATNHEILINQFIQRWIAHHMTKEEMEEQLDVLGLRDVDSLALLGLYIDQRLKLSSSPVEWEKDLLDFAVINIVNEILSEYDLVCHIKDDKDHHLFLLRNVEEVQALEGVSKKIESAIEKYLSFIASVKVEKCSGIEKLPQVYQQVQKKLAENVNQVPIVQLATRYIHHHYNEEISLQALADEYKISSTYLSRLMKRETGVSFIDYVTKIRIKKAMEFMKDPTIKLYQVAERVGYNSQHYFSTAFKKVVGSSPLDYRKKLKA